MQLRFLGKEYIAALLWCCLPPDWKNVEMVSWYPGNTSPKHPPKEWIELVWRYLRQHFTTAEEIQSLGKLPLIPLQMSQAPVCLTRLSRPTRVVVKRLNDAVIDDTLSDALTELGVIILNDLPSFISHHPAVLGTFVNPPSLQGVLDAMLASSSRMSDGMFSKIVLRKVSTKGKRNLRSFLANLRQRSGETEEYNFLCGLPVFETLSRAFVSKQECSFAAPAEPLPIPVLRDLINIAQADSKRLALLLDVRILTPKELLCEMVFPDVQQGNYSEEHVDEVMVYVLEHFAHVIRTDAKFKENLKMLAFVPKQGRRVRAMDLFDPRNDTLKKLFANENVFPVSNLYNRRAVLEVLEDLGMKNESHITSKDLYQSAKLVSKLLHLPAAKHKSIAILGYLIEYPQTLHELLNGQPLGVLLRGVQWVSRLQHRTRHFPPTLPWLEVAEDETGLFFKPTDLRSHHFANLIGTVKPVVEVESLSQVAKYFGWQTKPYVFDVVKHLERVICCYSKEEKPYYMVVVDEIYSFLSHEDATAVKKAFDQVKIRDWVWNGDGFSSPKHLLSCKPAIDLTPYILCLPSEMIKHSHLFRRFDMKEQCDPSVLLQVLSILKQKYKDVHFSPSEVKHDLQLSVDILNELANLELSPELQAKILLPVHIEDNLCVQLEPIEHCMYCENEWLKNEGDHKGMEYFHVHPIVPNSTAERLGVPNLTNRLLDPDELFIGEEFGQEEKLTTRLNRLLEEYTDGFAVLKELVQNADDGGATEVRFLYDQRTNEDATTCLIDEGLRGSQGPALWAFNDATFQDEDFVNITKLNEGTKVHDTEKIGKFGLGFSSVYNLTDVPMFVSRNYFAVFDPHTSYLGKAIKNKRKPGMKINLNKDVKRLKAFANQFKPFNGIFGCDLSLEREDNSFDGTLFRFPLRTKEQAKASEIKKLHYSDQEVRQLLQMFVERAQTLLLFTQNVFRVEIHTLKQSSSPKPRPSLMFQVSKSLSQRGILRELSVSVKLPAAANKLDEEQQILLQQCNFLQASSKIARSAKSHNGDARALPESSVAIDISCSFTPSGLEFFDVNEDLRQNCSIWMVVSSVGSGQAMQLAKSDPSLVPSAGVAVQLVATDSNTLKPLPVVLNGSEVRLGGTVFCFLPLPIHSGLPVHINGAFSVAANRRHLRRQVEDDKACPGVAWNRELMQDSVVTAYLCLLEDVSSVAPSDGSYVYYSLWPRATIVDQDFWPILKSFYLQLVRGGHALFSDGVHWVDVSQVVFLHPNLRQDPDIGGAAFSVLQNLAKENTVVIDMPNDVFQSFYACSLLDVIQDQMFSKRRFFMDVFFPNVLSVPSDLRDVLVLHVIDDSSQGLDDLLTTHACIPASPRGETLRFPGQLVHPSKQASPLFSGRDGRFPCGTESTYLDPQRLVKLEQLGMSSDNLPWEEVAERAESIRLLNTFDSKSAFKRSDALLRFLDRKIKLKEEGPSQPILSRLQNAHFLPVLLKPSFFPLTWKGEEFHNQGLFLMAPSNMYLKDDQYLVCCTEPIVAPDISKRVAELLKLKDKEVTTKHVINQLEEAMSADVGALDRESYEELRYVCKKAYAFLQNNTTCGSSIKEWLCEKRFILLAKQFLPANRVAIEVKSDCSPYLYKLPEDLSDEFFRIMKLAGVRERFEDKDYINGIQEVKKQFKAMKLDDRTLQVTVNMAVQLGETLKSSSCNPAKVQAKYGLIYLPSSRGVMQAVLDLCIKDCPWMPEDPTVEFVSEKIPWSTCVQLGVKTRREDALQGHDIGIPFGQQEKLTNRLKRILTGYPSEKEILKELVQNADDAQASEICFIRDSRHHPDERVFNDSWKQLQGPALCVYNNRPFTTADIKGIQSLGEGSKGDDKNKTGQYGVGFNAVYHLTDVPSFISKGKEIGDVMCVFDPHCKYAPNASEKEPGRMFKDIKRLKKKFPDVFPCYLEEHFPLENATLFRFPLKSEKMAEESKISSTLVTVETLDAMMEELKAELFELLLFVNNVKKITLAGIDENGQLFRSYSVEVSMSKEDAKKRQTFSRYTKRIADQVKDYLPTEIEVMKCTYSLILRDCFDKKEENWLVVQQIGFEQPIEPSIVDAFKEKQLGMLPCGGVACLLHNNNPDKEAHGKKKAYCFLPLPFETDLPVHVNGHFALDHEARRHLWRDEGGGYRSDWNHALLREVVASCYLTLLDEVRGFLKLPVTHDSTPCNLKCCRSTILERLRLYEELFPRYPLQDTHWNTLVSSVYQEMNKRRARLVPMVSSSEADPRPHAKDSRASDIVQLTWFPLTGTGKDRTYFNDLDVNGYFPSSSKKRDDDEDENNRKKKEENRIKRKSMFEEALVKTGFNLVTLSMSIFESLRQVGVEVYCISPSALIEFFKSFSDADPLCIVENIPCPVSKTPFKNENVVCDILQYCKADEHFLTNLPGLPLLLTQDKYLRVFSESDQRCLSSFSDILPSSPSIFVHSDLQRFVFKDGKASVFRPLDVDVFALHLHQTLPRVFLNESQFVKWHPDDRSLPNLKWVCRVWSFLRGVRDKMKKSDKSKGEEKSLTVDFVSPLSEWCILPATVEVERLQTSGCWETVTEDYLVPLNVAKSVVNLTDFGVSSGKLLEVLKMFALPELHLGVAKVISNHYLCDLVASPKAPDSLLVALERKFQTHSFPFRKVKPSDAAVVLDYFNNNVKSLTDQDQQILRRLPLFPKACGGLAELRNGKGFVIPSRIPKDEMGVVEVKFHCIFLKSRESSSDLYKLLKIEHLSCGEVYRNYVLECFQHLTQKARVVHMQYLRDFISEASADNKGKEEKEGLLDILKSVKFIPFKKIAKKPSSSVNDPAWFSPENATEIESLRFGQTGNVTFCPGNNMLMTASSFYDPENNIFKSLLPEDKFPPDPFRSGDWIGFLKKIGLIQEICTSDFLKFSSQIAHEAATARKDDTYKKSKVLVRHLLCRPNVVWEGLPTLVHDIPFVAPHPVDEKLQKLFPPFAKDGQSPFVAFKGAVFEEHEKIVWTQMSLLPRWADPRIIDLHKFCYRPESAPRYLTSLLSHLEVKEKPSIDVVVAHCKTICTLVENDEERCNWLKEVMECIYKFLLDEAMEDSKAKSVLQITPCILVEKGKKFILPSQAVIELCKDTEIKPFLYKVPAEFGKFRPLFESLGCAKSARPTHYAMVLEMLHQRCKNAKLHPNEVKSCAKAVKGFFESLQKNPEDAFSISRLYLPATIPGHGSPAGQLNSIPIALCKSNELMFNDVPSFGNRIQGLTNLFLLDPQLMNVTWKSGTATTEHLLMKLPSKLQPQMLSSVVKEKFGNTRNSVITTSAPVIVLKQQLSSSQFGCGMIRIIRHVNCEKKDFSEEVLDDIRRCLASIELCTVEGLKTSLFLNNCCIPGSEAQQEDFSEKIEVSGEEVWRVYINSAADAVDITSLVCKVIIKWYGELLGKEAFLVPEMLRHLPSKIPSLLDRMDVRTNDTGSRPETVIYPEPGCFIPIEDHHLLDDSFEEFQAGEFVGYQLHDPSLHLQVGVPTYVYAVITEEVTEENAGALTKKYMINIGQGKEPVVVSVAELYKFHRLKEVADQERECNRNIQQVFDEISELLKTAWGQPEERRRQIVKRLYLQWHPGKNLGQKEFCTKAFQHIQNTISRLGGSYDEFFTTWEARAREHGSQREEYRKSFSRQYGSWGSSSFHTDW